MVASVAEVVNEEVPPTVSTPLCVRLPTRSVTIRFRPMVEAASVVATLFVRLASAVPPVVLSPIAPLSALPVLVSVMVALAAEVVNEEVPATVKAPVCVRLPTVSVTVRLPPTFEAPNTVALALVRLALPFAPLVLSDAAPVSRLALVSVIVVSVAAVVNEEVPVTVSAPLWVRLPSVLTTVRLPPTLDVPKTTPLARSLVRLALPLAPLVVSDAAPVSRLALLSVMVALAVDVVNDDVPPTVSTPLCVRLPTRSVTTRLPPTFEAPSTVALLLVRLALPFAPPVSSEAAPVSKLPVFVSVIVAFVAEVVNDDVPATVKAPVCVRLPTVSVTVRLPPTFEAPSTVALALVRLALPLVPLVLSDAAPVSRLALVSVIVASVAEVVNEEVPPTVSTPLCVRLPTRSVIVRFRPMLDAASTVATLFVRLASAVPPVVFSAIAPLSALPVLVSVMVALAAEVVNEEVPATVKAPV